MMGGWVSAEGRWAMFAFQDSYYLQEQLTKGKVVIDVARTCCR